MQNNLKMHPTSFSLGLGGLRSSPLQLGREAVNEGTDGVKVVNHLNFRSISNSGTIVAYEYLGTEFWSLS